MRSGAAADPARLEGFRSFLRLKARLNVDPRLQGKFDLSGVVQQSLLEAHQGLARYRSVADDVLLHWLEQILARNVIDEVRRLRRVKHDVLLECSLEDLSSGCGNVLAQDQSTPSKCAARNEELLQLAMALDELTPDQQTAVVLFHLQGVSLADLAVRMGRSKSAVAGLVHRGIMRLQQVLRSRGDDDAGRTRTSVR